MKNAAVTILITLVLLSLGFYLVSFQVRETQSCLVTRFGKPTRQITEAGWYFMWPPPIERIYKFDSRMRVFAPELAETPTKGTDPIIVNTYVIWRISEPLAFFNAVGTIKEAENKLRSQMSDTQNRVIGQYNFSQFVNSDPSKIEFEQIEQDMFADIAPAVRGTYGIEIKAVGIKQLKINDDVSKNVFDRMRAERDSKTQAIIAQGSAEAVKIRTDADSKKIELLAAAEARAKSIRGRGDAEAAKYYKMFEADPKLAMFLRDIEAIKKILKQRSTVVLSADTEPFKLLKGVPDLGPVK